MNPQKGVGRTPASVTFRLPCTIISTNKCNQLYMYRNVPWPKRLRPKSPASVRYI